MTAHRVVVHPTSLDLLRATAAVPGADSSKANLLLGCVMDDALEGSPPRIADREGNEQKRSDEDTKVLVTVWEGDELRLLFSKLDWSICKLVSPVPSSQTRSLVLPLVALLVRHLLTLAPFSSDPSLLRSIVGPIVLVDDFLSRWPRPAEPSHARHLIPCSTLSAPPPFSFPPSHAFHRVDINAHRPEDFATLANFLSDFYGNHPDSPRLDEAAAIAEFKAKQRHNTFWLYRAPAVGADGTGAAAAPVAFLATGRASPRTVAVRMVYVSPSHRGQSIAQRMVAHVTRAHLVDANPVRLDLDDLVAAEEDELTRWGRKEEVCLFVDPQNEAARRVYGKVGLVEEEECWCTRNLEGVEAGHW
ncbi:GCN5-related N-acetyltransferase [Rhodotorula toruloides]|uniref:GCN5-related N-acetyltransferase n=1 Tax=Rhodotorula toruloides TaxID=5286 RepID=A0A511KBU9_RHOTO|nr:GCN5-related N-acetyltransferase [Rhodotorula toruloides]